jgi:cobalt/nickel transport system permease protein
MHLPDHFLDTSTTVATGVVAAAAVAMAVQRSRGELADLAVSGDAVDARTAVRTKVALVAATTGLVFAVQMLNYPVAAGTSGHLMGGALAAALLGPALGVLSITAVLTVQAVVFADGGLTALGPNVLLMAVVGTLVGWGVARATHVALRRRAGDRAVVWSAAAGALASVPVAAAVFAGLFAVGGTVAVPVGDLVVQMVGVHGLIGLGEAVITAGVVGLVHSAAPRSVVLASVRPSTLARPAGSAARTAPVAAVRRAAAVLGGLAAVAAVVISPFAATTPDGLEATALSVGFAGAARDHALAGAPLADYGAGAQLFVGVAGILGVVVCAALVAVVLRAVRPATAQA